MTEKLIDSKDPEFTQGIATGNIVKLTPLEAEVLSQLPTNEHRAAVYQTWKRYEKQKKWNSNIERIKAQEAFMQGCVYGNRLP